MVEVVSKIYSFIRYAFIEDLLMPYSGPGMGDTTVNIIEPHLPQGRGKQERQEIGQRAPG